MNDHKQHLHRVFTIKDLGHLKFFLGIEVNYLPDGITMTQQKFTQELLCVSGIHLSLMSLHCLSMSTFKMLIPLSFLTLNSIEVLWEN